MSNLYTRLSANFPEDRSRPFAFLPDGNVISYGELGARSAAYANALRAAGVGIGDRVAVQVDKGMGMLFL